MRNAESIQHYYMIINIDKNRDYGYVMVNKYIFNIDLSDIVD